MSVLFVHGVRTSGTMWRHQQAALAELGVASVAPDLPGHGSRRGEPVTLAAADVVIEEAVAALEAPVVVVGMSLGSYLLVHWAARTGRPPAALVLSSCGTRPRGPALALYRAAAGLIERTPDGGEALAAAVSSRFLDPQVRGDLEAGGVAVEAMSSTLRAVAGLDMLGDLARITAPIWFVNGTLDHFRGEERQLLRAAPAATLVHIAGGTHAVPMDRPAQFAGVVREVVAQVGALPRPSAGGAG